MKQIIEAFKLYGIKEIAGDQHNPEIVKLFAEIGHEWVKDDELAWCAAFANAILKRSGLAYQKTLNARSFLDIGEKVSYPEFGDIVVFWRVKEISPYGHVGFYINDSEDGYYHNILGGNQGNEVKISPYRRSRVLGYRKV